MLVHVSIVIPTVVMAACSAEPWGALVSLCPELPWGVWDGLAVNMDDGISPYLTFLMILFLCTAEILFSYQLPMRSRSICGGPTQAVWEPGAVR